MLPRLVLIAAFAVGGCITSPPGDGQADTDAETSDAGADQGPSTGDADGSEDSGDEPDQTPPMPEGEWCFVSAVGNGVTAVADLGGSGDLLHVVGACGGAACWVSANVSDDTFQFMQRRDDAEQNSYVQIHCTSQRCMAVTETTVVESNGSIWTPVSDSPTLDGPTFTAVAIAPSAKALADSAGNVYWRTADTEFETLNLGQVSDYVAYQDSLLWAVGEKVWSVSQFLWDPFEDFGTDQRFGAATTENVYFTSGRRFTHWNEGFTNTLNPNVEMGPVIARDATPEDLVFAAAGQRVATYVERTLVPVPVKGQMPESEFVGLAFAADTAWATTQNGRLYRYDSTGCE